MSCEAAIQEYLAAGEATDPMVEGIIHGRLWVADAHGRSSRRGERRLPRFPNRIELVIRTGGGQDLRLAAHRNRFEEYTLDLMDGRQVLRKLHTHGGHRNPRQPGSGLPGLHMHFPTENYPLQISGPHHSFAYPMEDVPFSGIGEFVSYFCIELGIEEGWQAALTIGGTR